MGGGLAAEELAEDDHAFFQPRDALARADAHRRMLARLRRAHRVGPPEAYGEQRAPTRHDVEARPLMREHHRMAMDERREAPDGEAHPRRDAGERREQRHGLEARLREEAIADPQRVEDAGILGRDGDVEQIVRFDRADHDRAIREDEAERRARDCHLMGRQVRSVEARSIMPTAAARSCG